MSRQDMKRGRRPTAEDVAAVRAALGNRTLVLVGLMGCGKSSVGRRLADALELKFIDADNEIETAAGQSIPEIFEYHGEAYFRDGERRVIARLLHAGPQVLATGGGAFMNEQTRANIQASGISIWLKADLPTLMKRVMRRDNRPLLKTADPEARMRELMALRYPVYEKADMTVVSREVPHEEVVCHIISGLLEGPLAIAPTANPASAMAAPVAVEPEIVHVALGERAYDVLIGPGLLPRAAELLQQRLGARKVAIVTDRNVAGYHLETLAEPFRNAGRLRGEIVMEPGEATKSFGALSQLCERLLETGLERGDLVIALGGGVIGDLAGFAAAILRRGVRFVQIPTSLLAQVDSSVGGKTGINTPQGKNLVGAFHQPSLVLADTGLLTSLPGRELRAGYAEVAKYGLLGDAAFFSWLEGHAGDMMKLQPAAIAKAVARSVEMKARIVERDETETGERMLLNLGHTFGHALEAYTGYSNRLLHGEGVAIGMCLALRLSEELGHCVPQTAARAAAHLKAVGLPTRVADIPGDTPDAASMVRLMGQDKKVADGRLTFILARAIGDSFVSRDVTAERVQAFLEAELASDL